MDNKYKRMNSTERVRIVTSASGSLPRQSFSEPLREEVLFSPAALAGALLHRILSTTGSLDYSSCKLDILTKEEFHLRQSVDPFVHYREKPVTFECVSREKIEEVAAKGKHCLLEAELSCVKDLLRREIYPIIIYVKICDKNVRKLRCLQLVACRAFPLLLLLLLLSEEDFVRQCRSREKELEGVACLYASVEPEVWAGPDDLVRVVKERIAEEQKKMIWVEQDLL
ncbi:hypothetical protein CRUP_008298 [Coryphaenoides rupestris]|nr:hypothetical protein CRUP_008298 [Coryphaenoides rupestris]